MTHQNTSGVGCARTAQKHVSPQNGASSKLEGSGVGCARTAQKHVSPQNGASSKLEGLGVGCARKASCIVTNAERNSMGEVGSFL